MVNGSWLIDPWCSGYEECSECPGCSEYSGYTELGYSERDRCSPIHVVGWWPRTDA